MHSQSLIGAETLRAESLILHESMKSRRELFFEKTYPKLFAECVFDEDVYASSGQHTKTCEAVVLAYYPRIETHECVSKAAVVGMTSLDRSGVHGDSKKSLLEDVVWIVVANAAKDVFGDD